VLQDSAGMNLPPPAKKTIDLEGRLVKDGVRKAIRDRQNALHELVNAINQYRKLSDRKPLTFQGSEYSQALLELNKAMTTLKVCCCSELSSFFKKTLAKGVGWSYGKLLFALNDQPGSQDISQSGETT